MLKKLLAASLFTIPAVALAQSQGSQTFSAPIAMETFAAPVYEAPVVPTYDLPEHYVTAIATAGPIDEAEPTAAATETPGPNIVVIGGEVCTIEGADAVDAVPDDGTTSDDKVKLNTTLLVKCALPTEPPKTETPKTETPKSDPTPPSDTPNDCGKPVFLEKKTIKVADKDVPKGQEAAKLREAAKKETWKKCDPWNNKRCKFEDKKKQTENPNGTCMFKNWDMYYAESKPGIMAITWTKTEGGGEYSVEVTMSCVYQCKDCDPPAAPAPAPVPVPAPKKDF